MPEAIIAAVIFLCLLGASLASLALHQKLPPRYRDEDTNGVVRQVANIFALMTSLVLGLMINSAKNTYEEIDHNVHTLATEIILFDRELRLYGPEMGDTRQRLQTYVQRAADGNWTTRDPVVVSDQTSERLLTAVGSSLRAIRPVDAEQVTQWREARAQYQKIVSLRWALLEQAEGTFPMPLLAMLVAWLMLTFVGFGYRAPRNAIVVATFVLSAALIAGSIYLILDMDHPFDGPIQVSPVPLRRALAEMAQ